MNVLCIIGNGFDLSLRLDTSYVSFYRDIERKYVNGKGSLSNICEEFFAELVDEAIRNCNPLWTDLELAIGMFDYHRLCSEKYFSVSNKITNIKWVLEDALKKFLCPRQISNKTHLIVAPNSVQIHALEKVQQLIALVEDVCKISIMGNMKSLKFMSLNYTDSLEFLYDNHFIIHHAHRSLKDGTLIFGVDNNSQLKNDIGPHTQLLTKIGQLRTNCLRRVEDATRKMIYESDVIVCYGLSLGVTDNRIWQMIRRRLDRSSQTRVVLCPYLKNIEKSTEEDRDECRLKLKRRFLRAMINQHPTVNDLWHQYDAQISVLPFIEKCVNGKCKFSNDYFGLDYIAGMLGMPRNKTIT